MHVYGLRDLFFLTYAAGSGMVCVVKENNGSLDREYTSNSAARKQSESDRISATIPDKF